MALNIQNVHILTKSAHERAYSLGLGIQEWLHERSIASVVYPNAEYSPDLTAARPDLILVLGGDGTMLSIAHQSLAWMIGRRA
jgi:NAD kinase